jgi:hypothetical protein
MGALALGLSTATACSAELAGPTPPSPGLLSSEAAVPVQQAPTAEGPGQTAPGIHLSAVPRGDGTFDVTEEVVLRGATSIVQLRPTESGERLLGMMIPTAPKATDLQVLADGQPVTLDQTEVSKARDLALITSATKLKLTYHLTGSSVRRPHSKAGRASAAISPLAADTDSTLPTNLSVSGGGLLNVVCPRLKETRCAVGEPPGLGIQQGIPAAQALAVLQLNLPLLP